MTLAAYECGSADFPEPPYPDHIVCPQQEAQTSGSDAEQVGVESLGVDKMVGSATLQGSISLWTIMSKVRLEACMWVSLLYSSCRNYRPEQDSAELCTESTELSFSKHVSTLTFGCNL